MPVVAGVDGCRGGWCVVVVDGALDRARLVAAPRFLDVLALQPLPEAVAIDIPIGLLEAAEPGGRPCDRAARERLGQPRARSVFSPPVRAALDAPDHRAAAEVNRASSPYGIGLTRQGWGLRDKIAEVDAVVSMDPSLAERVVECHPELSFQALNGGVAVTASKTTSAGHRERVRLLEAHDVPASVLVDQHRSLARGGPRVAPHDVLDAAVCAWSAWRVAHGKAHRVPAGPLPRDARGLPMAIWW